MTDKTKAELQDDIKALEGMMTFVEKKSKLNRELNDALRIVIRDWRMYQRDRK